MAVSSLREAGASRCGEETKNRTPASCRRRRNKNKATNMKTRMLTALAVLLAASTLGALSANRYKGTVVSPWVGSNVPIHVAVSECFGSQASVFDGYVEANGTYAFWLTGSNQLYFVCAQDTFGHWQHMNFESTGYDTTLRTMQLRGGIHPNHSTF